MVYFETRETSTVMGVKYTFPLRIIRFQVEKFLLLSFLNPNLRLTYFAAGVKPPIGILTFSSLQMRNLKNKKVILASLVAQRVNCLPAVRETHIQSLGLEDPLEKEMATHSSTLA